MLALVNKVCFEKANSFQLVARLSGLKQSLRFKFVLAVLLEPPDSLNDGGQHGNANGQEQGNVDGKPAHTAPRTNCKTGNKMAIKPAQTAPGTNYNTGHKIKMANLHTWHKETNCKQFLNILEHNLCSPHFFPLTCMPEVVLPSTVFM